MSLRDETVELTRALIRLDTSNPPGRETMAAKLVADHLAAAGIESELIGPDPDRLNLVARIEGSGSGPSILLMAHTDVVPAPDADWTLPPFGAEIRDGRVVGRGAADMKGELAARVAAFAELGRRGVVPAGDVVLIAEADEERNTADVGMSWLVREREDLRCDCALNEGGGMVAGAGRRAPGGDDLDRREAGDLAASAVLRPRRSRLGPGRCRQRPRPGRERGPGADRLSGADDPDPRRSPAP